MSRQGSGALKPPTAKPAAALRRAPGRPRRRRAAEGRDHLPPRPRGPLRAMCTLARGSAPRSAPASPRRSPRGIPGGGEGVGPLTGRAPGSEAPPPRAVWLAGLEAAPLGRTLDLAPRTVEAHFKLGLVLERQRLWAEAGAAYARRCASSRARSLRICVSGSCIGDRSVRRGGAALRSAADIAPSLPNAHVALAGTLARQGRRARPRQISHGPRVRSRPRRGNPPCEGLGRSPPRPGSPRLKRRALFADAHRHDPRRLRSPRSCLGRCPETRAPVRRSGRALSRGHSSAARLGPAPRLPRPRPVATAAA
jgi:hypothetical protein